MARVFIKAKIKKNRTTDRTRFEYPVSWDSNKVHVVAYEDNPESMGEVEEYCIGVVTPETWETMKNDPDITEVTDVEANEDGKKWKPQKERILDQEAVILVLAKPAKNRSAKEKNALDPAHEEIGINMSAEFDVKRFVAPGQIEKEELAKQ